MISHHFYRSNKSQSRKQTIICAPRILPRLIFNSIHESVPLNLEKTWENPITHRRPDSMLNNKCVYSSYLPKDQNNYSTSLMNYANSPNTQPLPLGGEF